MFELFVQGIQASDRARGGLGLGLTIVRNLVERTAARSPSAARVRAGAASSWCGCPGSSAARGRAVSRSPAARGGNPADELPRILVVDDNADGAADCWPRS